VATNATEGLVRTKTVSAASLSPQVLLADLPGTFSGLSLARGANGDTVAAWRHLDAAGTSYSVQARRRMAGGDWGALASHGPVPSVPDATTTAVDGADNATVGWTSGTTPDASAPFVAAWQRGHRLLRGRRPRTGRGPPSRGRRVDRTAGGRRRRRPLARRTDGGAPDGPLPAAHVGTRIRAGWIGDDLWSPISYALERQVAAYNGVFGAPEAWLSFGATDTVYPAEAGQTVCLRHTSTNHTSLVEVRGRPRPSLETPQAIPPGLEARR